MKSGILHISPRVGKTKIIIEAFKSILSPSHVITVPYNTIMDTWREESLKWGLEKELNIINQRSLDKVEEDIELLVIDEIHSLSDHQIKEIVRINPKRIIGLSGTLSASSKARLKQELHLKVVYEYTIEDAIKDNIVSNYKIDVVYLPLDKVKKNIQAGTEAKRFFTTEAKQYEYLTKQFNRFRALSWNDKKFETMKYKYAGERSRFIYSAPSKIELVNKIVKRHKKERKLIFSALTSVADQLCEYTHHSKSENNLDNFIDQKINSLAVCNMVDMGRPYMPL